MRFKIDENLPVEAAALLRLAKHQAETVGDEDLGGATDDRIAQACRAEKRILVTLDLDFADIRAFKPSEMSGTIVLRLPRQDRQSILAAVSALVPKLEQESPVAKIWIVDDKKIRVRGD